METKRKIRNALMALVLAVIAFTLTSCEAKFGGEITVGYFIGCVVCAIVGVLVWFVVFATAEVNDLGSAIAIIPALILEILPFLWHPIPKFNLILLIVNIAQIILIPVICKKIEEGEIKLPKSKKTREREAREAAERAEQKAREAEIKAQKAAERKVRKEQEAKELAEKEAKEAAERKAREEQEAKERADREAKAAAERKAEISKLEAELAAKQQELDSLGNDAMAIMKKAKLNNEIKALESKIAEIKG